MTTTYTWSFPHLEVAPSVDGLTNVVKVVHWRITATDDGHSAEAYGSVSLSDPDPDTFTAFDTLTKEIVQGWVEAAINGQSEGEVSVVDQMKTSLTEQIARAKAPPVVTMPAPWG
jgi:hypothetical protein